MDLVTVLEVAVVVPVLFTMVVLIGILHGVVAAVVLVDTAQIQVLIMVLKVLVSVVVDLVSVVRHLGELVETLLLDTVVVAVVDRYQVYSVAVVVQLLLTDLLVLVVTLVGMIKVILDGLLIVDIAIKVMGG